MTATRRSILYCAAVVVAAGLLYGALSGHSRFTNGRGGTDFNVFYLAGRTVLDGNAPQLYSVYTERGPGFTYIYLPLLAVLMAPLSVFPIGVASILWSALSLFMIFHAALILYRGHFPGPSGSPPLQARFIIYLILATVVSLSENLLLGQVHILLMYLMALAWTYQRQRMEWAAGAVLGAAAVLKLLPAVFALYFLLRRQYRALSGMLIAAILCIWLVPAVVIGLETNARLVGEFYATQVRPFVSGESADTGIYARTAKQKTLNDQDLGALLMRHFTADHYFIEAVQAEPYRFLNLFSLPTSLVRRFMYLGFLGFVTVTIVAFFRRRDLIDSDLDAGDCLFSLFVLLSLLLSPRIRLSYLTVLMIPYALLLKHLLTPDDTRAVSVSRTSLALSAGSTLLFAFPLFRALTVLYYGLTFLFVGLLRLLAATDGQDDR